MSQFESLRVDLDATPLGRRFAPSFKFAALLLALAVAGDADAQLPVSKSGEVIPRDVREMYDRGLQFLASTQTENGDWPSQGGESGPGTVGLALMAFLASGEDPNFGPYSNH